MPEGVAGDTWIWCDLEYETPPAGGVVMLTDAVAAKK